MESNIHRYCDGSDKSIDKSIDEDCDFDSSLSNFMSSGESLSCQSHGTENSSIWRLGSLKGSRIGLQNKEQLKDEPPMYIKEDLQGHGTFQLECLFSKTGPKKIELTNDLDYKKIIYLKSFKNNGTLFSHLDPKPKPFIYNVFDGLRNKHNNIHDSSSVHVELKLDHSEIYMHGLIEDMKGGYTSELFRNEADIEMLSTNQTPLTGSVILTIKKSSLILQNLQISLKGYSTEYVCLTNDKITSKTNNLLKFNGNGSFTYLQPFSIDTIDVYENYPILLSKGTYIIPFTFLIDPLNYHSSIKSIFGSTCYNIELKLTKLSIQNNNIYQNFNENNNFTSNNTTILSPMQFLSNLTNQNKKYETIFLTKECKITKTLSPSSLLKFESVTTQGFYQNYISHFDFFLSSKLIEINSKFQLQFRFLTSPNIIIEKVIVQLLQNSTIPCVELDGITSVQKSFVHSNLFEIAEAKPQKNSSNNFVKVNFEELLISSNLTSGILDAKILPYYNEISRLNPMKNVADQLIYRSKLKITHQLRITIFFASNNATFNLKIPVMVVTQNMSSSLHLPPYEPKANDFILNTTELSSLPPTYESACHY